MKQSLTQETNLRSPAAMGIALSTQGKVKCLPGLRETGVGVAYCLQRASCFRETKAIENL